LPENLNENSSIEIKNKTTTHFDLAAAASANGGIDTAAPAGWKIPKLRAGSCFPISWSGGEQPRRPAR
jgi:hypothetical protein